MFTRVVVLYFLMFVVACSDGGQTSTPDPDPDPDPPVTDPGPVASEARCIATDFEKPANITLEKLQLSQDFPLITAVEFVPGSDDFFVLQQTGEIHRVSVNGEEYEIKTVINLTDFYNVVFTPEGPGSCHECGLYSLAFHPDYETNQYVYLSFTEGGLENSPMTSYIARFQMDETGEAFVKDSSSVPIRENIYEVLQTTRIHNNGHIEFGSDGFLYAGFGDGGPGGGGAGKPQQTDNVFGSIIRITAEGEPAPGNNVEGGLPEIYAFGLRNPWQWSFDRLTGDLWLGDVGQASIEEINIIENGGNYGWPCFEGLVPYNECADVEGMIEPVWSYSHEEGRSVTGGFVYRGVSIPDLNGHYVYGDFGNGYIWALKANSDDEYERIQLIGSNMNISAFAENEDGELYVLSYVDGTIHKIAPPVEVTDLLPIPEKLSESGCFEQDNTRQVKGFVQAYDIIEPLWSDGATKERFFRLPEGEKIVFDGDGDFIFPDGTILIKNFLLNDRVIETRLMLKQGATGWSGYSYQWDGEDANLLLDGANVEIDGQTWRYPSGGECAHCHTSAANFSLGLEMKQLNRDYTDPATGVTGNQLRMLDDKGVFIRPIRDRDLEERLPGLEDISATFEERSRSYLHSNCSHCHRPGGTTQATLDFRFNSSLASTNTCNQPPIQSDFDLVDPAIISPGDASNSILLKRLEAEDERRMPPVGVNIVHQDAIHTITDWVNQLEECNTIVGPETASFVIRNRSTSTALIIDDNDIKHSASIENYTWKVLPAGDSYYYIQSADNPDVYLHTEEGPFAAGAVDLQWWSAMWTIEKVGDYFRIKNRWRALYVHLEGSESEGEVNLGEIDKDWPSAMWLFEQID